MKKKKKSPGIISITADSEHIYLTRFDSNNSMVDFDAFRWPVEFMKFKQAKAEIDEIHGMLYDNLNTLCNSTSINQE